MKRTLLGIFALLLAAFLGIRFFSGPPKGGNKGGALSPKVLPKGDSGTKGKDLSLKAPKQKAAPASSLSSKEKTNNAGGIPIFHKVDRPEKFLKLPDGTFVAPLNGVKEPAPFVWPMTIPFAPIVGKELDDHGRWWYIHKDGSRSTTYMAFHPQTGKLDARTDIANPTRSLPVGGGDSAKK